MLQDSHVQCMHFGVSCSILSDVQIKTKFHHAVELCSIFQNMQYNVEFSPPWKIVGPNRIVLVIIM